MDTTVRSAPTTEVDAPSRSSADRLARRLLGLSPDGPKVSLFGEGAFQKSIFVSGLRCLITYIFLPVLRPVVDLSGGVGPILGMALGTVSLVSIVVAMRRFFGADHKWRWGYGAIGLGIIILLIVQAVLDVRALAG